MASKAKKPHTKKFNIGDLVYIVSEGDKHTPRSRYIIIRINGGMAVLQKFTQSRITAKQQNVKLECLIKAAKSEPLDNFPIRYADDGHLFTSEVNSNHARGEAAFPNQPGELNPQMPDVDHGYLAPLDNDPAALVPIQDPRTVNTPPRVVPDVEGRPVREKRAPDRYSP